MEATKQKLIIYADAGNRPNPGYGGWGIHGYLYTKGKPKKGSGNANWYLTNEGYVSKLEIDKETVAEITPVHYVDGFGTVGYPVTNNMGEITAATIALTHALGWDISEVRIYTDSEHVVKGISGWTDKWERNGWKRADGQPVANVEYWQDLIKARAALEQRGTKVIIEWTESHCGHQGNDNADELATLGVFYARAGKSINQINTVAPEGYWKYEKDRHPFLYHPNVYFTTLSAANVPGTYYMGNHGKEDEMLGKRIADGCYAVVYLREPDPVIESVRNYQISIGQELGTLVILKMAQLFRPNTHRSVADHGALALERPNAYKLDLNSLDGQPVTRECKPAGISWSASEALDFLATKLREYQTVSEHITKTDLTSILYEKTIKTPKKGDPVETCTFNSAYDVGFSALTVEANYRITAEIQTAKIILSLGIDMPDRNSLKRLETKNPVVTLITWPESHIAFRYATVIEADGDVAIYAGTFSNLRMVGNEKAKS